MATKNKSVYDFKTLHEAWVFFNKKGIAACNIKIGGAFGRDEPTQDDDPVFFWDEVE